MEDGIDHDMKARPNSYAVCINQFTVIFGVTICKVWGWVVIKVTAVSNLEPSFINDRKNKSRR